MAEIIIVRSLTNSDLGIFAAHRASATSKQRAININAPCASRLLTPKAYENGGTILDCVLALGDLQERSARSLTKVHKNWRLGGNKIEGLAFASVDSDDFVLLRSDAPNDGTKPASIAFIARAIDPALHARISGLVAYQLKNSMRVYEDSDADFPQLARAVNAPPRPTQLRKPPRPPAPTPPPATIPPMPQAGPKKPRVRTIREKVRSATLLEQMLKVSTDLSAPAQLKFMDTVEQLAEQLRRVLLRTNHIIKLEKDHARLWNRVAGQQMGFVDGGMANLAMIGAAPVAVRVGGYLVTPGDKTANREAFIVLKKLISELYAGNDGDVYDSAFPDYGALRDAARISIEAAGAVTLVKDHPGMRWLFLHGALVNPVSRYSDLVPEGRPHHAFPSFTPNALKDLLPGEAVAEGREANFISVYLRQLQRIAASNTIVCGIVERESHTTSITNAVLNRLEDRDIQAVLPVPPAQWKAWFRSSIDPGGDPDAEGPRITDPLLFRCVLEPGEALLPVPINRNELRRAPEIWKDKIGNYPTPLVSYLQPTEWTSPVRIELFSKDEKRFDEIAAVVLHCALLLPRYAFPVGLDIVDKFAHIPDWISRPINTHTAVQALKQSLDQGDTKLFDALRRLLCGSQREWLLRPKTM